MSHHRLAALFAPLLAVAVACSSSKSSSKSESLSDASTVACTPNKAPTAWGESITLASNLTRTIGGSYAFAPCGDATATRTLRPLGVPAGSALSYAYAVVLPLFDASNEAAPTITSPAKIVRIDAKGDATDHYVFTDAASSFSSGFFQLGVTVHGKTGAVARGLRVSTALGADGALYVSNSVTGSIDKITTDGVRSAFATGLLGVQNIAFRTDGTLLATLPPISDNSDTAPKLIVPPRLVALPAGGALAGQTPATVFSLPIDIPYGTGLSVTLPGNQTLAVGFNMELAAAADNAVYLATSTGRDNGTGLLYKVDANGRGTLISDQLPTPIGVAERGGTVYVALTPILRVNGGSGPDLDGGDGARGIRIVTVDANGAQRAVYTGRVLPEYDTGFLAAVVIAGAPDGSPSPFFRPVDAIGHLAVDAAGDLYLQDSLANTLLVIPSK